MDGLLLATLVAPFGALANCVGCALSRATSPHMDVQVSRSAGMRGSDRRRSARTVALWATVRISQFSTTAAECGLLVFFNYGAGTRIRTTDFLITNEALYQLSYTGTEERYSKRRYFA